MFFKKHKKERKGREGRRMKMEEGEGKSDRRGSEEGTDGRKEEWGENSMGGREGGGSKASSADQHSLLP